MLTEEANQTLDGASKALTLLEQVKNELAVARDIPENSELFQKSTTGLQRLRNEIQEYAKKIEKLAYQSQDEPE